MPSSVVHLSLAGLIAAGLLGTDFDRRAVLVVLAITLLPDLDAFAGFLIRGGHRSVLHNWLIPVGAGGLLYADTRLRDRSLVRDRWGTRGVRVAWVSVVSYAFAAVGLDLVTGGANLFYPLHDQFYRLRGEFLYSTHRGWVQTFVEVGRGGVDAGQMGSTRQVHINSGVDPNPGSDEGADRIFPVAQAGWQLLLVLTSLVVLAGRFRDSSKD